MLVEELSPSKDIAQTIEVSTRVSQKRPFYRESCLGTPCDHPYDPNYRPKRKRGLDANSALAHEPIDCWTPSPDGPDNDLKATEEEACQIIFEDTYGPPESPASDTPLLLSPNPPISTPQSQLDQMPLQVMVFTSPPVIDEPPSALPTSMRWPDFSEEDLPGSRYYYDDDMNAPTSSNTRRVETPAYEGGNVTYGADQMRDGQYLMPQWGNGQWGDEWGQDWFLTCASLTHASLLAFAFGLTLCSPFVAFVSLLSLHPKLHLNNIPVKTFRLTSTKKGLASDHHIKALPLAAVGRSNHPEPQLVIRHLALISRTLHRA
ncbi:hypothetical protein F5888DRAFT_1869846 [Russula emetica]|nr:hypothetical protein F5888DRAFT_1869846 [Russula emetica]